MPRRYLLYGSERYAPAILRPVQAAIRARGDESAWYFDGPGAGDLVAGEQLLSSVAAVKNWNPVAVISPSNVVPHFFPGLKVCIFHGLDAGKPRHVYIRSFFDLYCTTGPRDTKEFTALAQKLKFFAVRETGWSKLDPSLRFTGDGRPEPVRQPPVVLYCSTFSRAWSSAEPLYETIRALSRTGRWLWIVTLHPKMPKSVVDRYRALQSEHLRFVDNGNIPDLSREADMMVSDTSSALHEFLLTHKPVVTFRNLRPGPQLIDIREPGQLEPAIEQALKRPADLMQEIRRYAYSIHPCRDGRASERVLAAIDEFLEGGIGQLAPKPLNLWRKLKIRLRIGYWRWS